MRKYLLDQLTTVAIDQAKAAATIPEHKAALTALRNVYQHCTEQTAVYSIACLCSQLESQLARLTVDQDKRESEEKTIARIAHERSPEQQIKRICARKTMNVVKDKPESLKHCIVTKVNKRYELRWLSKSVLLAEGLTRDELWDLKWFAQTHYAPITWIGDVPTK